MNWFGEKGNGHVHFIKSDCHLEGFVITTARQLIERVRHWKQSLGFWKENATNAQVDIMMFVRGLNYNCVKPVLGYSYFSPVVHIMLNISKTCIWELGYIYSYCLLALLNKPTAPACALAATSSSREARLIKKCFIHARGVKRSKEVIPPTPP